MGVDATPGYSTTKFTDLAIDWIKQQSNPWFMWLAYTTPHTPYHAPPQNMHSKGELSEFPDDIDADPTTYFMAMIESLDYELGRIQQNIPADELDNTIIIFLGDNGTSRGVIQSPYTRQKAKGTLYQGGIHVPMIIGGKNIPNKGSRVSNLVNLTDLFATIAELSGATITDVHNSHSFAPLLTSQSYSEREYIYSDFAEDDGTQSWAIRNAQYKLIHLSTGENELYDLLADPYETNNLFDNNMTTAETAAQQVLEAQANTIRSE